MPGVVTQDDPVAVHVQVEDAAGATQHVVFTNAFHVEKVNSLPVGCTTVHIDSAASCHMVSADSRISKHVVETSSATCAQKDRAARRALRRKVR